MSDWIASRDLTDDQGRKITVRLARPKPDGNDWKVEFFIEIDGVSKPGHAYGVDAFQALVLSHHATRQALLELSPSVRWFTEGDSGGFLDLSEAILKGFEHTLKMHGQPTPEEP